MDREDVIIRLLQEMVDTNRERNTLTKELLTQEHRKVAILSEMHRYIAAGSENLAQIRDIVFPTEDTDDFMHEDDHN